MARLGTFLILIGIFFAGLVLQSLLFLNWDVSWDLLVTKRLLAGGSYTKDFFDLNPPLVFYLYAPAVWAAHFFSVGNWVTLPIYMFLLGALSLFLSAIFVGKIFQSPDLLQKRILLIAVAFNLFILPLYEIGEREYITFAFILPYFLMIAARLQGEKINTCLAGIVGVIGSLGFLLKPYFLLAPFLLELYYLFCTRKLFSWLRVEVVLLVTLFCVYLSFIFAFHADYVSTLLPISLRYYYGNFKSSWSEVLFDPIMIYCYGMLFVFLFSWRKHYYPKLAFVLFIGLVSFVVAYLLQQTNWTYHAYPAMCFAVLMGFFLFGYLLKKTYSMPLLILEGVLLFCFPVYDILYHYSFGATYKKEYAPIQQFLQRYAKDKGIYVLSVHGLMFPWIEYAKVDYPSRFLHLFWMPAFIKMQANHQTLTPQQLQDEKMLRQWVTEEIKTIKPHLIFVDSAHYKHFIDFIRFNYLDYFLADPKFRSVFKSYHYLTTIEQFPLKTEGMEDWDLYWVPRKEMIDVSKLKNLSVILTGDSSSKIAYFAYDKELLKSDYGILQVPVTLSEEEMQLITQPGRIAMTRENRKKVLEIILRAVKFPTYRMDVYQRKDGV